MVDGFARDERKLPVVGAQPLETLALVRERLLDPAAAVDRALDPLGAARQRLGVREQERGVDAARFAEQRAESRRQGTALDPAVLGGPGAPEVVDANDPGDATQRG